MYYLSYIEKDELVTGIEPYLVTTRFDTLEDLVAFLKEYDITSKSSVIFKDAELIKRNYKTSKTIVLDNREFVWK